eukprot:gene17643-23986_t
MAAFKAYPIVETYNGDKGKFAEFYTSLVSPMIDDLTRHCVIDGAKDFADYDEPIDAEVDPQPMIQDQSIPRPAQALTQVQLGRQFFEAAPHPMGMPYPFSSEDEAEETRQLDASIPTRLSHQDQGSSQSPPQCPPPHDCMNCQGHGHTMDDCPSEPLPDPQSSTAPECSTCAGYGHTSKECPTQFSTSSEEDPPEDQAAGQEDTSTTEDPYADDIPTPPADDIGEIPDNLVNDPPQPALQGPLPAQPAAPMLAAPPVNPCLINGSCIVNTTCQRHCTHDVKTLIRVRDLEQPVIIYLEGSLEPIICVKEGTAVIKGHFGFLLTLLNVLVLPAPYKHNCISVSAWMQHPSTHPSSHLLLASQRALFKIENPSGHYFSNLDCNTLWGVNTLEDSSDDYDTPSVMAQLAKMKQSMIAILNKILIAPSTIQDSTVPSTHASGPPDPGPSDPGPSAHGPSAPDATTVPSAQELSPAPHTAPVPQPDPLVLHEATSHAEPVHHSQFSRKRPLNPDSDTEEAMPPSAKKAEAG